MLVRAQWVVRLAVAVLAAFVASDLIRLIHRSPGLPWWDEAAQGWAALQIADAVRHLDLLGALGAINAQVVWPFVQALLRAPFFLVLGDGWDVGAIASAVLFGVTVLAVHAGGEALHPRLGPAIGLGAVALLLASPIDRAFGALGLSEVPGALLLAVTVALHARCSEGAPRRRLVAAGLTTAALFLCKYNYGLLWLAGLGLYELASLDPDARRTLRQRIGGWFRGGRWRRPLPLLLLGAALGVALIAVTGGGVFDVFGRRVSVRSPANPAYALFIFALLAAVVPWSRRRAQWRAFLGALSERHRVWLATIVAPIAAWFVIPWPSRMGAFFYFVTNRATGPAPWSIEGLTYYPRVFARDYAPVPWLGWVVLALAVVPPSRAPRRGPARLVWLAGLAGLLLVAAHRYHDPRFLFTTAILLWLSAAHCVVRLVDAAIGMLPRARVVHRLARGTAAAALLVSAAAAAADLPRHALGSRAVEARRRVRSPVAFQDVIDRVLDRSQDDTVLLGHSNPLNPGLLAWRARQRGPERRPQVPAFAPPLDPGASAAAIRSRLDALRVADRRVVAVLADSTSPFSSAEYDADVRADRVTVQWLAADTTVRVEADVPWRELGLRLRVFRFTTGPWASAAPGR